MSLLRRLALVLACLVLFGLVELGLHWHLHRFDEGAYPELARPLAELPMQLTPAGSSSDPAKAWSGIDHAGLPELAAHLPYKVNDILLRTYCRPAGGPGVHLYMVYSQTGEDRKHHPEICIRDVSGAPEELAARCTIALDASGNRYAQRFRFITGPGSRITIYYWHYTLPPIPRPERDWLQTLHLQLRHPSPSLTVQVSALAPPAELEMIEQTFLGAVDAALQACQLPPGAVIGCNRLPIGLTRD